MNVLISGTSGFLGGHLVESLAEKREHNVIALDRKAYLPSHKLVHRAVLINQDHFESQLTDLMREENIEAVVHCAAMSSLLGCEQAPDDAVQVNELFTQSLAECCKRSAVYLCFISSDLVFDGNSPPGMEGFTEDDLPEPSSVYARTKRGGERIVESLGSLGVVLRASLLYGTPRGRSGGPLRWILDAISNRSHLLAYRDEWRTPLYVGDLVTIIERLLQERSSGIYHCGGPERLSRPEFILNFVKFFGADPKLLQEDSRLEATGPKRPEDVSLSSAKVCNDLQVALQPVNQAIQRYFRDYVL